MGLTKKQKDTLQKIGKYKENFKIRGQVCGETLSTIDSRLTTTYRSIKEHLEYLDEYYPIFERRIKREAPEIKGLLLKLNRKINESVRGKNR